MNSTTNNTNNTPATFNTLAAATVATAMPVMEEITKNYTNLVSVPAIVEYMARIQEWNALGDKRAFDTVADKADDTKVSVYDYVCGADAQAEKDAKGTRRAEVTTHTFKQAKTALAMQGIVELNSKTVEKRAAAMLAKFTRVVATKGTNFISQNAVTSNKDTRALVALLCEMGLVQYTGASTQSRGYKLTAALETKAVATREASINNVVKAALSVKTKPQARRDIERASTKKNRVLDTRKSMFAKENTAIDAIVKMTSTALRMSETFFTQKNSEGSTPAEMMVAKLVETYVGAREAKIAGIDASGGTDAEIVKYYKSAITEAIMGLEGKEFYQHVELDFAGRMYYRVSLVSVQDKLFRAYFEVAQGYQFTKAAKVAAVAKLRENLVLNGTLKSRMSLDQVAAKYEQTLRSVTVTHKESAVINKKGKVDPVSERIQTSLLNNDKMVNHVVGLDVTNQGSQNIAVITNNAQLFAYTGTDLTNTAYIQLAKEFESKLLAFGLVKPENAAMLNDFVTGETFKYRFMTVAYNKKAESQVFGSKHEAYARYMKAVNRHNEEARRSKGKMKERTLFSIDAKVTDVTSPAYKQSCFEYTSTYIAEEEKFYNESTDMELPVKLMLQRAGLLENIQDGDDSLLRAFIAAVNSVSPINYMFATYYEENMYTSAVEHAYTIGYTGVDGYNVLLKREAKTAEVVTFTDVKGVEHTTLVTTRANSNTEYNRTSGSPLFMQSIDAAQARSAVSNANAVCTIHDEYFVRLSDVEGLIANHTEELVKLSSTPFIQDHFAEANIGNPEAGMAKPTDILKDRGTFAVESAPLTEADIRAAKFCLWF